ncbi:E3 SUMO-protein ligase ZBED1 [Frankliniella fusca]|uniref:E3 SUMO-protein ligase ZBED1 n=1 Tax=Frankliniella fusca TaxID=407009 RepID=A0AAE1L4V2_9NEOP|nr:E3 SUMO-protein ligase ZBED1 [Frankliniella fusca]
MPAGHSAVWAHFKKTNPSTIQCLHCNQPLKYHKSTSSAINHLRSKHGIDLTAGPVTGRGRGRGRGSSVPGAGALQECLRVTQLTPTRPGSQSPDPDDPLPVTGSTSPTVIPVLPTTSAFSSAFASSQSSQEDVTEVSRPSKRPRTSPTLTPSRSGSLTAAFDRQRGFKSGALSDKVTDAILFMIAHDYQPIQIVENRGFQRLLRVLVPLYKVPVRTTFTNRLYEKYGALREKYRLAFLNITEVSLTMDIWTHQHTTKGYLGITSHFLESADEKDGEDLKSVCIGVVPLSARHTADYISEVLAQVCSDWGILLDHVVAVVTDGGANIKKAAKDTFGESKHLTCFAHLIQHIPNKSIEETPGLRAAKPPRAPAAAPPLPGLIDKVKRIVTYFRQSTNAADILKENQMKEGKKESECLKLIQDVETRWNSTLDMLERFVKLYNHVGTALLSIVSRENPPPDMVSASELSTLRGMIELLAPIKRITVELCAEKVTSVSKIIPMTNILKKKISTAPAQDDQILRTLQGKMVANIEACLGHVERVRIYGMATTLDPRFKNKMFESPIQLTNSVSYVTTLLKTTATARRNTPSPQPAAQVQTQVDDFWGDFDTQVAVQQQSTSLEYTAAGLPIELKTFLDLPREGRDTDPVRYWRRAAAQFPNLAAVARRHLATPATSVPSERLFSTAGYIASERRSRLKPSLLQALLFLGSLSEEEWGLVSH